LKHTTVDANGLTMYLSLVQEIAKDIFQEQSPKQLYQVRGKLYELLVNCLPPELILRKLALALIRTLDDEVRHKCIELAAAYEHRLQVSTRARASTQPSLGLCVYVAAHTQSLESKLHYVT